MKFYLRYCPMILQAALLLSALCLPTVAYTAQAFTRTPPDALNLSLLRTLPVQEARAQALALRKEDMNIRSWTELAPALDNSLAYVDAWPPNERAFEHSGMRVTWGQVAASLRHLRALLPRLDSDPSLLASQFTWHMLTPGSRFTSYYSPTVRASRVKKPGYTHPLYRLPVELAPHLAYCLPTHTCPEAAFTEVIRPATPFHSRAAIDLDGALRGQNLEMAWVAHPFDAYLLMLEGSGILAFDDGTKQAALFAGLNGNRGQSMAGYLMRTKQLAKKDATMEGMRAWWDRATPAKRRAFLEAATGYAFFRYSAPGAGGGPRGTAGCELTPWVSMAVDQNVLPLGGILAYDMPAPGMYKKGLGFAHDTGSAITMRRIDMFAGDGDVAYTAAMRVNTQGVVWLLLKK